MHVCVISLIFVCTLLCIHIISRSLDRLCFCAFQTAPQANPLIHVALVHRSLFVVRRRCVLTDRAPSLCVITPHPTYSSTAPTTSTRPYRIHPTGCHEMKAGHKPQSQRIPQFDDDDRPPRHDQHSLIVLADHDHDDDGGGLHVQTSGQKWRKQKQTKNASFALLFAVFFVLNLIDRYGFHFLKKLNMTPHSVSHELPSVRSSERLIVRSFVRHTNFTDNSTFVSQRSTCFLHGIILRRSSEFYCFFSLLSWWHLFFFCSFSPRDIVLAKCNFSSSVNNFSPVLFFFHFFIWRKPAHGTRFVATWAMFWLFWWSLFCAVSLALTGPLFLFLAFFFIFFAVIDIFFFLLHFSLLCWWGRVFCFSFFYYKVAFHVGGWLLGCFCCCFK